MLLAAILLLNACSSGAWAESILPDNRHQPLTQKPIDLLDASPELEGLMEESLKLACRSSIPSLRINVFSSTRPNSPLNSKAANFFS